MSQEKGKEVVLVEDKLTKIIFHEGEGDLPSKGQEVYALYKGTLQDGTEFDSNQDRESPFTFTIGQGQVIKGWDEGFASMKRGEKARLVCSPEYAYGDRGSPPKIPANATLNFDVELIDFKDKQKQKWELNAEEKLLEATKSKAAGNDFLKKGQHADAIKAYKAGIDFVEHEEDEDAKKIIKILYLNSAQAYLSNKDYSNCIENSGKVLKDQPKNAKALYRRGVAYSRSQEFDLAKTDFKQLLAIDPENVEAKRQFLNVAEAIKKFKAKEKKAFSAMFSKSLYDDKKIEPPKPEKNSDDSDEGELVPSGSESEEKEDGSKKSEQAEKAQESKAQQPKPEQSNPGPVQTQKPEEKA